MKTMLAQLHHAQKRLRGGRWEAPDAQALLASLRAAVPQPVLAHYLRIVATGRNGVAPVRHNVCGECHLRLPAGTEQMLARSADLVLCENCGSYLLLPEDETVTAVPALGTAVRASARRTRIAAPAR
jgi:predicted  nucleic acid-binding Zn-ribbon protein